MLSTVFKYIYTTYKHTYTHVLYLSCTYKLSILQQIYAWWKQLECQTDQETSEGDQNNELKPSSEGFKHEDKTSTVTWTYFLCLSFNLISSSIKINLLLVIQGYLGLYEVESQLNYTPRKLSYVLLCTSTKMYFGHLKKGPPLGPFLWHYYFSTVEHPYSYACSALYYTADQLFGSAVYGRDDTYKKIKMCDSDSKTKCCSLRRQEEIFMNQRTQKENFCWWRLDGVNV